MAKFAVELPDGRGAVTIEALFAEVGRSGALVLSGPPGMRLNVMTPIPLVTAFAPNEWVRVENVGSE